MPSLHVRYPTVLLSPPPWVNDCLSGWDPLVSLPDSRKDWILPGLDPPPGEFAARVRHPHVSTPSCPRRNGWPSPLFWTYVFISSLGGGERGTVDNPWKVKEGTSLLGHSVSVSVLFVTVKRHWSFDPLVLSPAFYSDSFYPASPERFGELLSTPVGKPRDSPILLY